VKEKALVSFSTYNAPSFVKLLIETLNETDAGFPFDLLIYDNSSTDSVHLLQLDKLAKTYDIRTRPNLGRAQGGYAEAFNSQSDYRYYLFMHDDSFFVRDNWLRVAVDRMHDVSVEHPDLLPYKNYPVGKIGYQSYEWGTLHHYLDSTFPAIFRFMDPLNKSVFHCPKHFQHINDDRILYTNKALTSFLPPKIWNIEWFRNKEKWSMFQQVNDFFQKNYPGRGFIEPKETYSGADWEGFQTLSEFMNDITPMEHGFRTHNVIGNGYCQEKLGWDSFWGNEYIAHFGSHNVFKRLAIIFNTTEESVRASYKDVNFLRRCVNIIRKETTDVR
jgi:hypothetical protein